MGGKSQTISVIPELINFFSFDQVVGQRIFNYQLLMKIPTKWNIENDRRLHQSLPVGKRSVTDLHESG